MGGIDARRVDRGVVLGTVVRVICGWKWGYEEGDLAVGGWAFIIWVRDDDWESAGTSHRERPGGVSSLRQFLCSVDLPMTEYKWKVGRWKTAEFWIFASQ